MNRILLIFFSILLVPHLGLAQNTHYDSGFEWELGPTGSKSSLRGLSAASDTVIWASGSLATVLRTVDGGSSWTECGPSGYGDLEFRSIHAWSDATACIASAGTPAVILRTDDGGESWQKVYEHASPKAFFDALRFWDSAHGMAFSDPVDGKILIVETADGGQSWSEVPSRLIPVANDGEAGFAASNSSLALAADGQAWIGTGGATTQNSRVFTRSTWGEAWRVHECVLPSDSAKGIFSIVAAVSDTLVAVGGDYRPDERSLETAAVSKDGGVTWRSASQPPSEFRSAVVQIPTPLGEGFIATGPTGSDYSSDGDHWQSVSMHGFHVLAASASHVFAAGSDGRFAILKKSLRKPRKR